MGAGASSRHAQLSLTDPKVCRSFLVGTCPHDLFTNTKQDLGPCPRVHSEPLKTEYESAPDKSKYGFEYDYMRDMQKYIDECNRRIDAAQRRLEKTPDEIRQTNDLVSLFFFIIFYFFLFMFIVHVQPCCEFVNAYCRGGMIKICLEFIKLTSPPHVPSS